ncbi:MAG TPA: S24 family peptidase [Sphingomonas sp.]|nr:S24 family peptidase [Sphingomonas sp.]
MRGAVLPSPHASGVAVAGVGRHAGPIDLSAWLIEHPAASYVMRVEGRSMADAGIIDGDLLVVNRAKSPRTGATVVALVHG